ncbi:MAG: T9SS type A sorting domain-containing protein [Saprospiraceae bacterium]|nr:T9SS type A sorting domain-containing protein [Saprospiraceae bacterium]
MKALNMLAAILVLSTFTSNLSAQCETINLACNNQINVSINEDCYAAINADLLLENPPFDIYPDDGFNYIITLEDEWGLPIVPSNQVGHEYINQLIKAKIELEPCGISCWGEILVEDKIGPKIWNCINGSLPTIELDCDEFADGYMIDEPTLGSICPEQDFITFEDDTTMLSCTEEFAFSIFRIWTASDAYGNSTSCNQTISIRKYDLKDVVIPDDYIVYIDQDKHCEDFIDISPEKTGLPTGIHCPNIMYHYSDITYPQCGKQIKLLRDWFVIDWCTGVSINKGQIIKYIDNTPPQVACIIDTLFVGTDPYLCGALPILNPFRVDGFDTLGTYAVLDTCPDMISLTVGILEAIPGEEQPLNVPYYNVPQSENGVFELPEIADVAWVRYCFTDACGNGTKIPDDVMDAGEPGFCHYFKIKAVDDNPPTPICEGFTKVPLGSHGLVEVPAEKFDDHSFDPCGDVSHFEVKRESFSCPGFDEHDNDGWGESVHFCCQDLGDTITIRLRVFDINGNFSECLGLVCVSDSRTPVVQCPDPIVNLDCGDDYQDSDLTGLPEGDDGCSANIIIGEEEYNLSNYNEECGVGTIIKTIRVRDLNGTLIESCHQDIVFDPALVSTPLEVGDYDFPEDLEIDVCVSGGSLDPVFTGFPTTTKEFGCANIAISYEDDAPYSLNTSGVCYTILRRWKVVDWCNYRPTNPNEYVIYETQEIKITDSSTPIFNCPSDFTVEAHSTDCEADVDLLVNVSSTCNSTFNVRWTIDAFSDGDINYSGTGNDASGSYPVGEHTITYTGSNLCGGAENSCSFKFTVTSNVPPLPICLANVVWSLGNLAPTEIWASDFDLKSEGACGLSNLTFSFVSPLDASYPVPSAMYDCSDIPNGIEAEFEITVFVIDDEGRFSSCNSTLQLQDTQDLCTDVGNISTIGGNINTEMSEPLENVMVELHNMSSEETTMEMTTQNGGYAFENISSSYEYEVQPHFDYDYLNGVSTLDLIMIQRHVLGLKPIESPYGLIAADVNNSGSVSAIDLIQLRKLILGVYSDLPENESWVFVPQKHKFVDTAAPWDYPRTMHLENMNASEMDASFVAVKVGDINNSVDLSSTKKSRKSKHKSVFLSTPNVNYSAGELVAVPLNIDKAVVASGMQFTLNFDDSKLLFEGIDNGALEVNQENFSLVNSVGGALTFSFSSMEGFELKADQTLFTIYFEAKKRVKLSEVVSVSSNLTSAEIYSLNNDINNLELVVRNQSLNVNSEMEVFQNEPNPFEAFTRIAFSIPERGMVTITILDANGRLLVTKQKQFEAGVNEFVIDSNELDANGVLLYRVASGSSSITKKMIMVK